MKKVVPVLFILFSFLCSGCGVVETATEELEASLNEGENYLEEQTGVEVDANVKIGIEVGLFSVSRNHRGELEIAVQAETPGIPTPLGAFSVFVEAEAEFPHKQTLTISTARQTWIYDLNGRPFAVELHDIDAEVSGNGDGNILIRITDGRVRGDVEPQFHSVRAADIAMNAGALYNDTFSIGRSANNQEILVTQLGEGSQAVVLVGGFHAGFVPASVELAEEMITHFQDHPEQLPLDVRLYIIPLANPDSASGGVEQVSGRVNGNGVDINRNWDCNWTENAVWRSQSVGAGDYAFSEPENQALRDFFLEIEPEAVIFWEARGELVIPGRCGSYHSDSQRLASVYGANSGYEFGFITGYQVTGDVADWLDQQGIAAISILLSGYRSTDWQRNLRGVQDVLQDVAR